MILHNILRWHDLRGVHVVRANGRLLVAALLTLSIPMSARAQQPYLLGTLPLFHVTVTTPSAIGLDVNDSGMVVGQSRLDATVGNTGPCSASNTAGCMLRAYSWTRAGGMNPIPPLPGGESASSNARAVNNSGQVVGRSGVAGVAGASHAFLWTATGGTVDLGVLGSSASITPSAVGNGINNVGTVVGASSTDTSNGHAFIWTAGGGMVDLGTLGGPTSQANDVNDAGVVVGSSATASGAVHAFVWTEGGMVDIGTLGGTDSMAFRINNAGVVVGQAKFTDGNFHAFKWTSPGPMVDLGTLGMPSFGGPVSMAVDINDSGQIVGSTTINGVVGLHPFLWTPTGGMVAISSQNAGGAFGTPSAINNIGNVVGTLSGNTAVIWRALQQDLIMDFGAAGTWLRRGTVWSLLNGLSAKSLTVFPEFGRDHDDVVIDFGPGVGLWAWLGDDTWLALSALSPTATALFDVNNDGDDDVVFNFPGNGIWWFNGGNGTWGGQLHPANASSFVSLDLGAGGKKLVVDFPGFGLWTYSAAGWQSLHQPDVTSMITTDLDGNGIDDLVVNFPTYGVWALMNGTTWIQINSLQAQRFAAGDLDGNGVADLVIDFGAGVGVWARKNLSTWTMVNSLSSENIVVGDLDGDGKAEVIIDFGPGIGLWAFEEGRGWQLIHPNSPGALAAGRVH